jgi:cellulose synthase/poly-beta-1,6-N-acetylglucosamine synthase-like glycosyltransferase
VGSPRAGRPAVSVVVPFLGDSAAAARTREHLQRLGAEPTDQLIVADNGGAGIADPVLSGLAQVIAAADERSSYHARNRGAELAEHEWILFLDADCAPAPGLLDRYFEPHPEDDVGLLAGAIADHPEHESLLARYARSRNLYRGADGLDGSADGGYAPTGNLMVRRSAFAQAGGFERGIRSAGDVDLCWRLQANGWRLVRRPEASASHRHREDLGSFLSMLARYGSGAGWLNARYPGSAPRWPLSPVELARSGADAARLAAGGNRDEAAFRLVDAIGLIAHNVGYHRSNEVG